MNINFIFPLIYSITLFFLILIISIYVFIQIRNTQNLEKRLVILEKRIQSNNFNYDDFYKLGQLYLRKKIYKKAIALFRKSLENWDINDKIGLGSLYNTLGFTYFNLKQYEYAAYYYNEALKLLPDYTLALTNLGLAYEKVQKYEDALTTYKKVLRYTTSNKITNSRLTLLERKLELRS
ncbi:unnamed protein product [Chrysoparadoxa australica]